jgi:hypothetical protein
MVPQDRIELSTYPLPRGCATTTLLRRTIGPKARGSVAIAQAPGERKVSEQKAEAGRKKGLPAHNPPTHKATAGETRALKSSVASAKEGRLAAALRENLKRRKAQARAKEKARGPDAAPHAGPAKPHD